MKRLVLLASLFLSTHAFAGVQISKELKGQTTNEKGEPIEASYVVNFYDAVALCKKINARLPTPREWAEHASSNGAKKIREPRKSKKSIYEQDIDSEVTKNRGEGYLYVLTAAEGAGATVDFYYNSAGYRRNGDHSERSWYWTSQGFGEGTAAIAYVFDHRGEILFQPALRGAKVRCAR